MFPDPLSAKMHCFPYSEVTIQRTSEEIIIDLFTAPDGDLRLRSAARATPAASFRGCKPLLHGGFNSDRKVGGVFNPETDPQGPPAMHGASQDQLRCGNENLTKNFIKYSQA
jgi:hypothetical protein